MTLEFPPLLACLLQKKPKEKTKNRTGFDKQKPEQKTEKGKKAKKGENGKERGIGNKKRKDYRKKTSEKVRGYVANLFLGFLQ